MKRLIQSYISRCKLKQFCVANRGKATKGKFLSLGEIYYKKLEFNLRAVFFSENFLYFLFFFKSHLETSHFSYRGSVNDKPHLHSLDAQ